MKHLHPLKKADLAAFRSDIAGGAAVEFAFVLPALMMLLLGIGEFGRMMWTQNTLQYAVEGAARCAVVNTTTCGTATQIESYASSLGYAMKFGAGVFSATTAACGSQVAATLPYTPLLPIPIHVTLTASSCRPA